MINALKNPSFFRPISRPSSPAPSPAPTNTESAQLVHPLNKLSRSNFRRPSPSPGPPPATPSPALVQDGTYLELLSLKFSEGVSKSLAQPTGPVNPAELLAGKRPLPAGRGSALGSLIASELIAARDNPHLTRAILRCLHRPLSVLLNNLSSILLPLLASPSFLNPPAPTPQAPNPNATQIHALAIARFAEELLQVFDQLELVKDSDPRSDSLRSIREGLVSLVNKVTTPLVNGIRNELITSIDALERPNPPTSRPPAGTKVPVIYHPSIITMQTVMPIYARVLARYTSGHVAQATLANLLISVLWKGMVALSNRTDISLTPPPSPTTSAVAGASSKKRRGSGPSTTPPVTPPPSRFTLKLPPSRPPSPPTAPVVASAAADGRALLDLVNTLPRPSTEAAREAVDEAFEGFRALLALLEAVPDIHARAQSKPTSPESSQTFTDALVSELEGLTGELPTLVALPSLLRVLCARDLPSVPSVAEMLGLSEEEYRRGCLSGFGRAEECAGVVGQRVSLYLSEYLRAIPMPQREASGAAIVLEWLEEELHAD